MEHEIGPQHARDRAGSTQARRQRRLARAIERHEGERRDDAGGKIEEQVFHMPHVVLDVVAEDPQKPHVAGQMHDAAVHEDCRQQRHPRRDRRGLEAGIGHLDHALGCLDHPHRRLGDDVSPRDDLGGHLAIGERDVVVGPHLLEHHEYEHVHQQQCDRHVRKDRAVGVVVAYRKDHGYFGQRGIRTRCAECCARCNSAAEAMDHGVAIGLPRIEPDGRPVSLASMVDGIGIFLRLQADGRLLRIGRPALARD